MKTLLTTVAALVLVTGCTGNQPSPPCLAAHGSYAVEYTLTSAAPPAGSPCDLAVGIMGVEKYNQVPDAGVAPPPTLGLRPLELADGLPTSIAVGTYVSAKPDDQRFCHVDTFANDAVSGTITYKYSNVDFYVEAKAPGTQMKFDVEVTDTATSCTATYSATGVWPVVGCSFLAGGVAPADENCALVDSTIADGNGWSYSALNPDFDVKCVADPNDWIGWWNYPYTNPGDVGAFCVLRGETFPSFCPEPDGCSWRPEE
jgi:hypothetical protein